MRGLSTSSLAYAQHLNTAYVTNLLRHSPLVSVLSPGGDVKNLGTGNYTRLELL